MKSDSLVIIPTYNEKENIKAIIEDVASKYSIDRKRIKFLCMPEALHQ